MICIICKIKFIRNSNNQKCCSKECKKIYKYQYNKDFQNKYQKEWRENNKNYDEKRYQENREKILENNKQYRIENKEKIRQHVKEYQQTPKAKQLERKRVKRYRQTLKGKRNRKKYKEKRYRNLGLNPLNEYFEGSEGHHINRIDVIYIPKLWHFKGHNAQKNINMESINTIAFFFLVMQNIEEIQKII